MIEPKQKQVIAEMIFKDLCEMSENALKGAMIAPNHMRPIFEAMERFNYLMHSDNGYLSNPINRVVIFEDVYTIRINEDLV